MRRFITLSVTWVFAKCCTPPQEETKKSFRLGIDPNVSDFLLIRQA
jgi:hypothetical protein